jgi:hypothetical protein
MVTKILQQLFMSISTGYHISVPAKQPGFGEEMLYLIFYPLRANAQKPEIVPGTSGAALRDWNRITTTMANQRSLH